MACTSSHSNGTVVQLSMVEMQHEWERCINILFVKHNLKRFVVDRYIEGNRILK